MQQTVMMCDDLAYTLSIKNVKYINLRISDQGEIKVSANRFVKIATIELFVRSKKQWILQHLAAMKKSSQYCAWDLDNITLLGYRLKVKTIKAAKNLVTYDRDYFYVYYMNDCDIVKRIHKFLDTFIYEVFNDVVEITCNKMDAYKIGIPKLKLRFMKKRWGSCIPGKNTITLNKKLIHYPLPFIEYVVLHELAHFVQPNHSKEFYSVIREYMPDYKDRIKMSRN